MSRKKTETILRNVIVENVAAEGRAVAHVDGAVLFVEFAVPGDVIDVKVTKKKKNYMEGRMISLVKPSDSRLEPFCSHFGLCGGCKWQPLPYEMQLRAKQRQVQDQLVRIGHLDVPEIAPILPSDKTRYYRNKLEYTFSAKRWMIDGEDPENLPADQRNGLGFHVGKFFDKVLDIRHCYLQAEPSNEIRLFLKQYAASHSLEFYDIRENTGYLRSVFIRNNEDGDFMIIVCFAYDDSPTRTALLDELSAAFPQIKSLYYVINTKVNDSIADQQCILYRGEDAIYEKMDGLRFKIGPKSFYQTNSAQAHKLYCVAKDFAGLTGKETVYDLYTGTGTIAQFLAADARKVIGIEYVPEAISDAVLNAEANNIANCEFFAGDMKDVLNEDFVAVHGKPDVVILDPPRAGIHPDVASVLMRTAPETIVYVSCNPASQARDLAVFAEKYEIVAVQPVDMFPHTIHVENVCKLILK